jgi:phosphoglycerate dehydrogenase-like enzyme
MKPTILITDTLFISPKYVKKLEAAGFAVERNPNGQLPEAELIKAIKGKVGYIIGGTESVTDAVIKAADQLKIIAFTGTDAQSFIPAYASATEKGIAVTNTPGTTTFPVAEFTLTLMLMMLRRTLELGGPGQESFKTTQSLADVHIGLVGLGRIGTEVARMLTTLGAAKVSYWNRHRKLETEKNLGIAYLPLKELFAECHVISNHIASTAGELITADLLNATKTDVLFINTGAGNTYNLDALYNLLHAKKARAAFDIHGVTDERYKALPLADWYVTNGNTGFNTQQMLDSTSAMATQSVINVITTGDDTHIINK